MRQLEPRAGKRIGERRRIFVEAFRDRPIRRIEAQREIGREHHRRVTFRRDRAHRARYHSPSPFFGVPTDWRRPGSSSISQSNLKRLSKKLLSPRCRCRRPCALESARDRCDAVAAAEAEFFQPKTLLRDASRLRAPGPTYCDGSAAPCTLPNVCPPAMSATVSSSSIAMRANVSRMSCVPMRCGSPIAVRGLPDLRRSSPSAPRQVVSRDRVRRHLNSAVCCRATNALVAPIDIFFGLPHVDAAAGEAECL